MTFLQALVKRNRQGMLTEISTVYNGLVDAKLNRVRVQVTLAHESDAGAGQADRRGADHRARQGGAGRLRDRSDGAGRGGGPRGRPGARRLAAAEADHAPEAVAEPIVGVPTYGTGSPQRVGPFTFPYPVHPALTPDPTMLLALVALASLQQATPGTGPAPYWQQRVDYVIGATLDETRGVLSGNQIVHYKNNSPDSLRQLSFHLYLNAFRPGSRWADADSIEHNRRFNDLKDPNFGFNHVSNVPDHGPAAVQAIYPFAPDSTIVRFMLPRPLAAR